MNQKILLLLALTAVFSTVTFLTSKSLRNHEIVLENTVTADANKDYGTIVDPNMEKIAQRISKDVFIQYRQCQGNCIDNTRLCIINHDEFIKANPTKLNCNDWFDQCNDYCENSRAAGESKIQAVADRESEHDVCITNCTYQQKKCDRERRGQSSTYRPVGETCNDYYQICMGPCSGKYYGKGEQINERYGPF